MPVEKGVHLCLAYYLSLVVHQDVAISSKHTQFHISKSLRRNRVYGENASEGVDLGSTESFWFITVGTLEILNIVLLHI